MGREWTETSEVKHNHLLDTNPGGITQGMSAIQLCTQC